MLQKLASVERASEHPLAMAIVMDAQERKLPLSPVTDFDSPVGKGVIGTVEGQVIVSGSAKFLAEHGVDTANQVAAAEAQRQKAATVIFVGVGGLECGVDYAGAPAAGVDVFSWSLCATVEAPVNGWPLAGGGNRILWDGATRCQRTEPGGAGWRSTTLSSKLISMATAAGPAALGAGASANAGEGGGRLERLTEPAGRRALMLPLTTRWAPTP